MKIYVLTLDRRAAKNFEQAARMMIAAGLPGDLPVTWEITNGQFCHGERLENWYA
jgi:hypothetical protein